MHISFKQTKIIPAYIGALALMLPYAAFAQPRLNQPAPGVGVTLNDYILWLIEIVQAVGTPLLVVAIIYTGFKFVSAQGNEEELSKAKVMILWTLVGAAVIISAQVIAGYIQDTAATF